MRQLLLVKSQISGTFTRDRCVALLREDRRVWQLLCFAEMQVGEVYELLPIVVRHVMLARADMISDGSHRGLMHRWHGVGR